MKKEKALRGASLLMAVVAASTIFGCGHYEANTGRGSIPGILIRSELQDADRAVEAARVAGKDKTCPDQFKEAADTRDRAYDVFRACHDDEGVALAKQATAKANALCPTVQAVVPPPAPVVSAPAPVAPSDNLTVVPPSITKGETATLTWTSANATNCDIQPGIGAVQPQGSMTVTPADSTAYNLTCTGAGGSATSAAQISVTAPTPAVPVVAPAPVPAPAEKLCKPATLDIHFDTNKSNIKPKYHQELKTVADFLKEFPNATGVIEGHTDNVGKKAANVALSQRRADSVRDYLIKNFGIAPERLKAIGYGPSRPIADNKTAAGKAKNRRIETNFSCDGK